MKKLLLIAAIISFSISAFATEIIIETNKARSQHLTNEDYFSIIDKHDIWKLNLRSNTITTNGTVVPYKEADISEECNGERGKSYTVKINNEAGLTVITFFIDQESVIVHTQEVENFIVIYYWE